MKLAQNRWNIAQEGLDKPVSYYGYKTRKEAQAFADRWNATHEMKVHVIDTNK